MTMAAEQPSDATAVRMVAIIDQARAHLIEDGLLTEGEADHAA